MEREFSVERVEWAGAERDLRLVRETVFVAEQAVPLDLEWDGLDPACEHVLARAPSGEPVGCGRLLPDGHIGRMAVLRTWRGRGVGSAMLLALMALAARRGHRLARLNAQVSAAGFYGRFGFRQVGGEFPDAGIPHIAMERPLDQPASANS